MTLSGSPFLRVFLMALVPLLLTSPLRAESVPIWLGGGVQLDAKAIYETTADPIVLTVTYPQRIDLESLSDGDLWVVSRNGFNQVATFVAAALPKDALAVGGGGGFPEGIPDILQGLDGQGKVDFPGLWRWVSATYHLEPPNPNGWTEADNGRYAVLLQPDEVRFPEGGALAPSYFGDFEIAIGEPRPAIPSAAPNSSDNTAPPVTASSIAAPPLAPISPDTIGKTNHSW